MKQYSTTILLWAALLVGEVHTLWENSTKEENWIIAANVKMPVQWNVKFAGEELIGVLVALAMVLYRPNRINYTATRVFLLYYIADFLLYFYNYKREGYGWIYTFTLIAWILIYNHGKRPKDRQRISY